MKRALSLAGIVCLAAMSAWAYVCGDANGDQDINMGDVVYLINHVFKAGPAPEPVQAGDANLDGHINIADVVYVVNYVFHGGPAPCTGPIGSVIGVGDCKTTAKNSAYMDCIEYQYDGIATLTLKHVNATFNCCISGVSVLVRLEGSLLTISEYEEFGEFGPCYCLCPFDVDMVIQNLPPGEYTIYVEELYLGSDDEPLEFTVDLSSAASGEYCVEREY